MNLFSCLPWFATKAPIAPDPTGGPTSGPVDDANDRHHRERIATQLSACRRLARRVPDAETSKALIALLNRAEERFTRLRPDLNDTSLQFDGKDLRDYELQPDLAPLLERIALKLSDDEIPWDGRIDALTYMAVALGRWPARQSLLDALVAVHDKVPPPDRHRAVRQAVANGDAAGLATSLDALQRRRPRPNPRELLSQTLCGRDVKNPPITLLAHAVARGHAEVAAVLTRTLTTLRRARVIDARDQINYLKQALQPSVLHQASSSPHAAASVKVCVDALCMDKGLQASLRRAMPSIMNAMIQTTDGEEAFPSLLSQMGQTRQGRAVAAQALQDFSREGVLGRLCLDDAPVQPLSVYLRGLTMAARTGAVSGRDLGRLLLAPGQTGRPAIADARGQLRTCMRRMLEESDILTLLGAQDLRRLRAAVGPA